MLGDILRFLLEITSESFRGGHYCTRLDPCSKTASLQSLGPHTIFQATNWLIVSIRKIVQQGNSIDWSSLVAAWLAALVYLVLMWMASWASLLPSSLVGGLIVAALLTVPKWAFNLIVWLTLIQAILSWVNPMAPMMALLKTLTAPLLDPIRRLLPATPIDFSPLVVLVLAQVGLMILSRIIFALIVV